MTAGVVDEQVISYLQGSLRLGYRLFLIVFLRQLITEDSSHVTGRIKFIHVFYSCHF